MDDPEENAGWADWASTLAGAGSGDGEGGAGAGEGVVISVLSAVGVAVPGVFRTPSAEAPLGHHAQRRQQRRTRLLPRNLVQSLRRPWLQCLWSPVRHRRSDLWIGERVTAVTVLKQKQCLSFI